MRDLRPILFAASALSLAACYDTADDTAADASANAVPAAATVPAAPTITASSNPEGLAIDKAEFVEGADGKVNPASRTAASTMSAADKSMSVNGQAPVDDSPAARQRRVLIKAQVLLDRARHAGKRHPFVPHPEHEALRPLGHHNAPSAAGLPGTGAAPGA